jgi:hypothetical protein
MNDLQNQIKEFENLANDYEVVVLLMSKDKQQEIFQKLNIDKKNRSNIYYV